MKENHRIVVFFYRHAIVFYTVNAPFQFGKFVVMGCKQRFRADFAGYVFHNCPRNAEPVKCRRAAPHFVQNYKAVFRSVVKNVGDFDHFHHKGTLVERKVVACTHARKNLVNDGDFRAFGRHETADVRHKRD